MEERRGEGGLRRGHVVTLREHESVRAGRSVRWTEIQEHGRLRDLVRTRELATILDLEVMERSRAGARSEAPVPSRGFGRAWARALAGRRVRLAEAGLLVRAGPENERGGGVGWVALPQAVSGIALQAKQRDRSALSLAEVETLAGKRLEQPSPNTGRHEGTLVASAHDTQGRRFAVLDVGSRLIAIPSQRRDLEIGSRVEARRERPSSERGLEPQVGWQLTDRERERVRGRGR
jgi:hypothetical protein